MKRLICRLFGHDWSHFCDGLKRKCIRCEREDWVTGNPYPRIGEPKWFWKEMGFDRLKF